MLAARHRVAGLVLETVNRGWGARGEVMPCVPSTWDQARSEGERLS